MDSNDSYIFSFGGLLLGGAVGIATRQLIEEKCIVYMHYVVVFCLDSYYLKLFLKHFQAMK